jgi:putative transposase
MSWISAVCKIYHQPSPLSEGSPCLVLNIDELNLKYPIVDKFLLRDLLNRDGFKIGCKHVSTLMKYMGTVSLSLHPNTSKQHALRRVYRYLHRSLTLDRANQVRGIDITNIPIAWGFAYLCADVERANRKVLDHRFSINIDVAFCLKALEEDGSRYGKPVNFTADRGSQFPVLPSLRYSRARKSVSDMDGKDCWRDNVFVEQLMRTSNMRLSI